MEPMTFTEEAVQAARKLVLEKGTSVPNLLIAALTVALMVGLFTPLVGETKFREMCGLYAIVFPAWAAGGIGKMWMDGRNGTKESYRPGGQDPQPPSPIDAPRPPQ